ncbi:LuxR C-terminal-related transcriptional regulator [Streptomyces sp. H27-G5]|uniref:helix-turn-helix transcriptional regulator n=1 Tax=Streptomyces sp. H27-G5 TaxID=2996698 RepID=UPI00226DA5DF|nr:LuxR family transcriptional regulator [Streptomyces sp. H27-G5]MCY0917396.1 LuxR C-terminal-related transcriptional regulator [Streptomyces sp. H27-G5]
MRGRNAERDRIEQLLVDARQGKSGALLLHGDAGIGKTALLDHAADREDGTRVLRVEGIESEMELAFGGLHQLFLPVLDLVDGLPQPQAAALRAVFGLTADGVRDPFTVGLAVLTMLSEAASGGPLLCLVDDAQWLDQPSVDMLTFAARRLRAEGVVMLFAVRDGAPGAAVKGLPRLHVEGLERADAAELLPGLPPYVADRVIEEARGNPLALIELSAALTPAQRAGRLGPLALPEEGAGLPSRIQDGFLEQIRRLPEAAQAVLLVAAADDSGDLTVVLRAAQPLGAAVEDLEPAERAGFVRVSGTVVRFRHPLVRYAAYQGAPLARRIAAHRALARALGDAGQAHRRAWHLAAASTGPDERVAEELERVAEWAGSRQAMASASAAYERAAQLTADPGPRARRLVRAAQRAADAGQDERCGALADQVPLPLDAPGVAADFARARAVVELGFRRPETAARILLDSADLTGTDRPDTVASLLTDAVHAAFSAGDATLIEEIASRGPGLPVLAVPARLFGGDVPGALDALRALVQDCRDPATGVMDRLMTGIHCQLTGDHAAAREAAAGAVAHCREQGIGGWLPTTLHLLAQTELALGRHDEASAHAAEGLRLAEYHDLAHRAAHLRAALAMTAAVRGDEEQGRALAAEALAYTRPRGVGRGTADALWALGVLELGLGRAEAALEPLESALHPLNSAPEPQNCAPQSPEPARSLKSAPEPLNSTPQRLDSAPHKAAGPLLCLPLLADLVEAAGRAGRPERAKEPARLLGEWATALGQPALSALARRCQALTGPDSTAEEHFTAALALHENGSDYDRARTALLYGEWLRRLRRQIDARDQLRAALEAFERLGARPWAGRARAELGAAGGETGLTTREDGPISLLSPQEREVVRLAAAGASNREIAAQLFLSPRTVGHHLYRAFPKLGVGSRTELAALLAPVHDS